MNRRPRIALISAVTAAIPPAEQALAQEYPEAEVWNILDDRLLDDADAQGGLTPALGDRMRRLIAHAASEGAAGVLLTCSMYAPVAMQEHRPIPVLAPDEAVFADIAADGHGSVLVVASFPAASRDATERLAAYLAERRRPTAVAGVVADGAREAVGASDAGRLVDVLARACLDRAEEAVVLAQFSLAPAREALAARIGKPVYAGPQSAARTLRRTTSREEDARDPRAAPAPGRP